MTNSTQDPGGEFPVSVPRASNVFHRGSYSGSLGVSIDFPSEFVISSDPLFVDTEDILGDDQIWGTEDDGLRLSSDSSAIGKGNVDFLPEDSLDVDSDFLTSEDLPIDAAGYVRIQNDSLDLGAYEFGDSRTPIFELAVTITGEGSVDFEGSNQFTEGTSVSSKASPSHGYKFDGWTGDKTSDANILIIEIDGNKSITANFSKDLSDSDSDGLTLFQELAVFGTDPNLSDSSGDGLSDGLIATLGLNPQIDYSPLILTIKGDPSTLNLYTEEQLQAARTIVNVSARVSLGEGEIVTPGFVVLGESKQLLIPAIGPKLADLGVPSPLPDPTMTIYRTRYDGQPNDVVAIIDDWKEQPEQAGGADVAAINAAMATAGAFPLEPAETFQGRPFMTDDTSSAAALVTLDVGVYTVQVSSADEGVGEVLVEVYEITD